MPQDCPAYGGARSATSKTRHYEVQLRNEAPERTDGAAPSEMLVPKLHLGTSTSLGASFRDYGRIYDSGGRVFFLDLRLEES